MFGLAETVALNRNASIRELAEKVERIKGYIKKCTHPTKDLTHVRNFWYGKLEGAEVLLWELEVEASTLRCCICNGSQGVVDVDNHVRVEKGTSNVVCNRCKEWAFRLTAHSVKLWIAPYWEFVSREEVKQ